MNAIKGRLLLCSADTEFVNAHRPSWEKDFEIQQATHPDMALFLVKEWEPNLCVIDGDSTLARIIPQVRQHRSYLELGLVVVANEKTKSLEEFAFRSGADHFLIHPVEHRSLSVRLQALLRRLQSSRRTGDQPAPAELASSEVRSTLPAKGQALKFGGITIFPGDFLIKRGPEIVGTTPTQFRLLLAFVSHKDQLLTRAWIKESVWDNADISPRSIDAQISKLKRLIPELDRALVNIYGKGYVLTEPRDEAA